MTQRQYCFVAEAVKNLQNARKWLDQAMYYSGEQMPERDFQKVRKAYQLICDANDNL